MAIFRNQMMPLQPQGGGIGGLFSRLRRPITPLMGGFGGFGGGGFGPPPFDPRMRGGFPGMGGGFFGGFRPRFKRRPRPQMPDYSSQISGLEAKIAELQEQLAARQAATPMPDPVMDVAEPRPPMQVGTMGGTGYGRYPLGTAGPEFLYDDAGNPILEPPEGLKTRFPIGGMGPGEIQIPNISDGRLDALDLADIEERIANLNIDIGERPDMPVSIPGAPNGRPVKTLPLQDVGGRKKLTKGPGMPKKIPMKPPSIARLPKEITAVPRIDRGIVPPPSGGIGLTTIAIPNIDVDAIREREERVMPPLPQVPDVMPPMPEEMVLPTTPQTGFFGKIQEAIEARRDPMEGFIPFVPPQINEPMPMPAPVMPAPVMPAPVMPAPVMPKKIPMPSLPKFSMPQIDLMGRVAAPLTRGPVNTAINRPQVAMRGPGMRMR